MFDRVPASEKEKKKKDRRREQAEPFKFRRAFFSLLAWHFGWQWVIGIISHCAVSVSVMAHKPVDSRRNLCVLPHQFVPKQISLAVATGQILIGRFCLGIFGIAVPVLLPQSDCKSFCPCTSFQPILSSIALTRALKRKLTSKWKDWQAGPHLAWVELQLKTTSANEQEVYGWNSGSVRLNGSP